MVDSALRVPNGLIIWLIALSWPPKNLPRVSMPCRSSRGTDVVSPRAHSLVGVKFEARAPSSGFGFICQVVDRALWVPN